MNRTRSQALSFLIGVATVSSIAWWLHPHWLAWPFLPRMLGLIALINLGLFFYHLSIRGKERRG